MLADVLTVDPSLPAPLFEQLRDQLIAHPQQVQRPARPRS
jgi:hypothetical protein